MKYLENRKGHGGPYFDSKWQAIRFIVCLVITNAVEFLAIPFMWSHNLFLGERCPSCKTKYHWDYVWSKYKYCSFCGHETEFGNRLPWLKGKGSGLKHRVLQVQVLLGAPESKEKRYMAG